jgi:hypothetical protein
VNSIRAQVIGKIKDLLIQANVANGQVFRARTESLNRTELPAVVIKSGAEKIDNTVSGCILRRFTVHIEVHARGDDVDLLVDPTIVTIYNTLMANKTLGGLVRRLWEEDVLDPDYADADGSAAIFPTDYVVIYATPIDDLTKSI